jgi:hypothetical protein
MRVTTLFVLGKDLFVISKINRCSRTWCLSNTFVLRLTVLYMKLSKYHGTLCSVVCMLRCMNENENAC